MPRVSTSSLFLRPMTQHPHRDSFPPRHLYQDGATGLIVAAQHGHEAVVRLLLENGASVDAATQVVTWMLERGRRGLQLRLGVELHDARSVCWSRGQGVRRQGWLGRGRGGQGFEKLSLSYRTIATYAKDIESANLLSTGCQRTTYCSVTRKSTLCSLNTSSEVAETREKGEIWGMNLSNLLQQVRQIQQRAKDCRPIMRLM
jgi:hypothetical protein